MEMLVGGEWCGAVGGATEVVRSPYDGHSVGSVPVGGVEDAAAAIDGAEVGHGCSGRRGRMSRSRCCCGRRPWPTNAPRTSPRPSAPKPESRSPRPVARPAVGAHHPAGRLRGKPAVWLNPSLDANTGTGLEKIGFTVRQPWASSWPSRPFNYPALLVLHKIAPALAAGNAVVLKPARATPLTALKLAQCFVDAGCRRGRCPSSPDPGSTLGDVLVTDPRVRKVSFTGSTATGTHQRDRRGQEAVPGTGRRVPGDRLARTPISNWPRRRWRPGDLSMPARSASRCSGSSLTPGGSGFPRALVPKVEAIAIGDPTEDDTRLGSLISEEEATRVHSSIRSRPFRGQGAHRR